MKRLALLMVALLLLSMSHAQFTEVKTVLFLMPFFGEEYSSYNGNRIQSSTDIDNEPIFSLVGFWEGAQMALNEYETRFQRIDVVAKDITYNNEKLIRIMEDEELMSKVDLIIGPFFASQFEIAARYAKSYQIPIVNPFTSKQEILDDNEFVYKVQSSTESVSEIMKKRWFDMGKTTDVFLWTEKDVVFPEMQRCERYFASMDIPYKYVFEEDNVSMKHRLNTHKQNVVMAFLSSETTIIAKMRDLGIENDFPNTVFIVPREWLEIGALEVDYLNKLNVHFFSDYFVDEDNDAALVFMSNFIEKYNTPPELKRFSFQGYDITKYFVELMLQDFDASKVRYSPVSMKFNFKKTENGGYENHGIFLLQLKDYKIRLAD